MSTMLKIGGIVIALIAVFAMYVTSIESANETIAAGRILPTPEQLRENMTTLFGQSIVLFVGFGIFALGVKLSTSSK